MGQVQSINQSEAVAEILNTDVTTRMVKLARQLIDTCPYTTTALLAFECALRELYNDCAADGDRAAPLAGLISSIVRQAAELESVEL